MSGYFDFEQDGDVLQQLFNKIAALDNATTEEAGLMSASDKEKLDGIESGAEENAIATIQIGGTALTPDNKVVNIETDSEPTFGSVKLVLSGPLYTKFLSYYTKTEVDQLVAAIHQFVPVVADSLPEASADTMYLLYLIPSTNPKTRNAKDEFITIRSGSEGSYTYAWEQIGTTTIDISGKEDKSNKVISFSNPTDAQYPSAKLVSDSIDKVKADVSSLLTKAGIAEGIADTISAGTAQEFLQRQSGGDGVNCIKRIKGKTIAWNQLAKNGNFTDTSHWTTTDATLSALNNIGTMLASSTGGRTKQEGAFVGGHKYLFLASIRASSNLVGLHIGSSLISAASGSGSWERVHYLWTPSSSISTSFGVVDTRSADWNNVYNRDFNVYDLTLLGLGDLTADQFAALYPKPYYPTVSGVLKNNDAVAMITDGFNQWEEIVETGFIDGTTGQNVAAANNWRSKGFIPMQAATEYYLYTSGTASFKTRFYDADKNYIGAADYSGSTAGGKNYIMKSPNGCAYFRFAMEQDPPAINICINLSNPAKNGIYEPYWSRTSNFGLTGITGIPEGGTEDDRVTIFPDGLAGAGSAFDSIFVENGVTKAVKRLGKVDLGDLSWSFNDYLQAYAGIGDEVVGAIKPPASDNIVQNNIIVAKPYTKASIAAIHGGLDKAIGVGGGGGIVIHDSSYATASAFATAISGVYFVFELATPIVYTDLQYADGTPFTMPATILVDNYGKEVIVPPTGATTPSAPFCCDSNYSISIANIVKKLNSNE